MNTRASSHALNGNGYLWVTWCERPEKASEDNSNLGVEGKRGREGKRDGQRKRRGEKEGEEQEEDGGAGGCK